jgi:thiol-disulfide isomerase/thioredoxin
LIPDFQQWVEDLRGKVDLAFFTSGSAEENRDKFGDTIGDSIYLQNEREVATMFRAQWTPSAVFMNADGRIASHIAAGDNAIRALVESLENDDLQRDGVHFTSGSSNGSKAPIGQPVPEFRAEDTRGREITHDDLKGKQTLVAFWSSTCPHCVAMIDELREWEQTKGVDDPNLLVFTEAPDSIELNSPVIVDPEYATADALGMYGTPSAVLVNENGIVVSETATGATDIWALIGKRK